MGYRRRRIRDINPRWVTVRYAGKCAQCGATIEPGTKALYQPATKTMLSGECADSEQERLQTAAYVAEGLGEW